MTWDEFGPLVSMSEFISIKETPCGYWIRPIHGGYMDIWKKWIPKVSRKRFAYPTQQEALNSFIIRKKRQLQYLTRDTRNVKAALAVAEKIKSEL